MSSGRGENLAQRVAHTKASGSSAPPQQEPAAVPAIKHCWYDGPHGRQAALLLEWRRLGDGFDGRIAVAVPDASGWGPLATHPPDDELKRTPDAHHIVVAGRKWRATPASRPSCGPSSWPS